MCRRYILLIALTVFLTACTHAPAVHKIALLAPFEGQYSTIGYNALYAARYAVAEAQSAYVELLALDDGGTPQNAHTRLKGLEQDPTIRYVIVLTPQLTPSTTSPLSLIHIADWQPSNDANTLNDGEWLIYKALGASTTAQTIHTLASPITPAFAQAYRDSAPYAPAPNILAPLVYDVTHMLIRATQNPDLTTYQGQFHQLTFTDTGIQASRYYHQPVNPQ